MSALIEILPVSRSVCEGGLGIASIEAWPAAGGGLLVGMAEPAFAGTRPLRRTVKTVFLRIGAGSAITLILPYVSVESEARRCIRTLVAAELAMPEESIGVDFPEGARDRIVDVGTQAERSLQACAAVTRTLLITAAAELWDVPNHRCRMSTGMIMGPEAAETIPISDIAADGALVGVPTSVRLLSGRKVSLRAHSPTPRSCQLHPPAVPESIRQSIHTQRIQP